MAKKCANSENSANARKSSRVLILFGVFSLCVVGAWGMATHRGRSLIEGKNIILEMRQNKLNAFWQAEDSTQWFLIRSGRKNIGWQVQYRRPNAEGGFEGGEMRILFSSQGTERITSRWILNNEITKGAYISDVIILGSHGNMMVRRSIVAARIDMNAGKLDVQQKISGAKFRSQADEPDGYIPEGTLDLLSYMVAKRKTKAKFRMIIDSLPPSKKWTNFITVEIRYSDATPISPGGSAVVVTMAGHDSLCFFDKNGKVEKQIVGDIEETAVTEEEIIKAFPNADPAKMLKDFMQ